MKTSEINIRDPFILVYDNKYFLYGSGRRNGSNLRGFDVVTSTDLENWSEHKTIFEQNENFWADRDYWAPEVHEYKGKFYLFASFKSEDRCRGTQILVCDTPDGTFKPITEFPVTPENWECLDGTLFIEDGKPYIVFCHEWTQIQNGTICAMQLSEDLKEAVGEPVELLKASDLPGVYGLGGEDNFITDGP
ncbi:MAG: family 43 glycosylhydrolase, partial [Clostridia bacterium]|nr:family 43 glycosylhydrolase [Clostridia bacterium]